MPGSEALPVEKDLETFTKTKHLGSKKVEDVNTFSINAHSQTPSLNINGLKN